MNFLCSKTQLVMFPLPNQLKSFCCYLIVNKLIGLECNLNLPQPFTSIPFIINKVQFSSYSVLFHLHSHSHSIQKNRRRWKKKKGDFKFALQFARQIWVTHVIFSRVKYTFCHSTFYTLDLLFLLTKCVYILLCYLSTTRVC